MESIKHKQMNDMLAAASHILILPDERLDGDSLGAAVALYRYLNQIGKKVSVHLVEEVPEKYQYLPDVNQFSVDRSVLADTSIDLVVSVDCSARDYIASIVKDLPGVVPVINVDHHITNSGFGDLVQVVPDTASTTEVVYRFFLENKIKIDSQMATALLAGIYFDTTVFSNRSTKEQSMNIASELILLGARVNEVVRNQHSNRSLGILKVWGLALERLRKHPTLGVVVTWIRDEDIQAAGLSVEGLDGLSNFLHGVIEEDTIIVLREQHGGVKVSMRTLEGDVGSLAKLLGGGGHVRAAGFEIAQAGIFKENNQVFVK